VTVLSKSWATNRRVAKRNQPGDPAGAAAIPAQWIEQVDYATAKMPVTNSRRSLREHAGGLCEAYRARLRAMRACAEEMEKA
jgi:hypothetical protein